MRIECQADSTKLSFSNIDAQTDIQKIITINYLNKGFVLHETITATPPICHNDWNDLDYKICEVTERNYTDYQNNRLKLYSVDKGGNCD